MRDLNGRCVWLTGASSGIGEALAYALAQEGARLILSARNQGELERVRAACVNAEKHVVVPLDLEKYELLEATAEEVWSAYGPIDVLINNAGLSQRYLGVESSLALDQKIMNVNFFGTTALTRPILRKMLNRKNGHIVVVSSVLGLYGIQTRTAYSASKHALRGYFNSLRNELWKTPLKITLIYPGYVTTQVSQNALDAKGQAHNKLDSGHQKGMSPTECARKIVEAVQKDASEVVIAGPKEALGVLVARFLPGLFRRISPKIAV